MNRELFSILIDNYLAENLSENERLQLVEMLNQPEYEQLLHARLQESFNEGVYVGPLDNVRKDVVKSLVFNRINTPVNFAKPSPVRRLRWMKWAAAIFIATGVGAYLWNTNKKPDQTLVKQHKYLQTDIPAGGDRAILTLADGRTITLDSAANGNIAQQSGAQIIKLANGQIVYDLKGSTSTEVMWNNLSTPRGGQYQVALPDGTKVWLNAASSITFPAAFTGNKREVKIQGEVYFEVAKNKQKPFIVNIDGGAAVQVLGTSFNINSYVDEGSVKTTLLEGSIRVSANNTTTAGASSDQQRNLSKTNGVILNPGQQAMIFVESSAINKSGQQPNNIGDIIVKSDVDLDQALAWKNGIFNFNGADLKTVMRQLERWYDIKVQYKGSKFNEIFQGEMYRNVNLSDVLEMLNKMGVKFELEGKNLIVL